MRMLTKMPSDLSPPRAYRDGALAGRMARSMRSITEGIYIKIYVYIYIYIYWILESRAEALELKIKGRRPS